jgi:hypothetical protein
MPPTIFPGFYLLHSLLPWHFFVGSTLDQLSSPIKLAPIPPDRYHLSLSLALFLLAIMKQPWHLPSPLYPSMLQPGRQIIVTDEGTDKCLSVMEPPRTPENVRKYRKSYFSEAGQRVVHPGLIEGPPFPFSVSFFSLSLFAHIFIWASICKHRHAFTLCFASKRVNGLAPPPPPPPLPLPPSGVIIATGFTSSASL